MEGTSTATLSIIRPLEVAGEPSWARRWWGWSTYGSGHISFSDQGIKSECFVHIRFVHCVDMRTFILTLQRHFREVSAQNVVSE